MKNIKLITYLKKQNQDAIKSEKKFKSLNQLKKYVKECGGIKNFKWKDKESSCIYFITGECDQCNECYYEYKNGKYSWFDCNGYRLKEVK